MPRTGLTSEQLKEKAIDCAIAQMKQIGFDRVKLSDIAKDLGVSHAALYGHFADKSALFDAVSERWLRKIDTEQEELCTEKSAGDALHRLTQWIVRLHHFKVAKVQHEPELFKAFSFSARSDKPFIQSHMQTMQRQLRTIVAQAMESGLLKARKVEEVVAIVSEATLSFHHPALVAAHVGEEREPLLREILQTVLAGLK